MESKIKISQRKNKKYKEKKDNTNANTEKEIVDIDKIIDYIEFWLRNGLDPNDLSECEKNIMKTWKGEQWMNKWIEE